MDPDANLREQRKIAADLILAVNHPDLTPGDAYRHMTGYDIEAAAGRLAELTQALDRWLCSGGFYPALWKSPRLPSKPTVWK